MEKYRRRLVTRRSYTFPTVDVGDIGLFLSIFRRYLPPFWNGLMSAVLHFLGCWSTPMIC